MSKTDKMPVGGGGRPVSDRELHTTYTVYAAEAPPLRTSDPREAESYARQGCLVKADSRGVPA